MEILVAVVMVKMEEIVIGNKGNDNDGGRVGMGMVVAAGSND